MRSYDFVVNTSHFELEQNPENDPSENDLSGSRFVINGYDLHQ
jgi:hypothetical protein